MVEDEEDSEMSDGEGVDKEAMADAVRFMKAQQQAEESEARQTSTPINGNSTVRISLTSSTDGKRRSRAQVEQSAEDEDDPEVVDSSPIPTKRPRRQVNLRLPTSRLLLRLDQGDRSRSKFRPLQLPVRRLVAAKELKERSRKNN